MFKLKQLVWCVLSCALMFSIFSCSSDDDNPQNTCTPEFASGTATGMFMGSIFTFVEGTASENFADSTEFRFTLYGEEVMGDACDGFNFDKPDLSIIFSVPKEVGVYNLGSEYTVTFNDASVVNQVNADAAICGAVEIISVSNTEIMGRLDADANEASMLNGVFTVERCN